jgi:hypothetical protein
MANMTNTGTGSYPLDFAKKLTQDTNEAWESGSMLDTGTPHNSPLNDGFSLP